MQAGSVGAVPTAAGKRVIAVMHRSACALALLLAPLPALAEAPALAVQVFLDRAGFSPGVVDGGWGKISAKALAAFQEAHGLSVSGALDPETREKLVAAAATEEHFAEYAVTSEDLAGPFVESIPEDMDERAKLPRLGYTSASELLAEKFHTTPKLLHRLNPGLELAEGAKLWVPNVQPGVPTRPSKGSVEVVVASSAGTLIVRDDSGVLFFAPTTSGSEHDPLPLGEWKVRGVARDPAYHYNPALFWDADPSRAKATIAPGPNNPVGSVWIDLTREHYGIHGTPEPSRIGYTESHGCVRLTNWDALRVAELVQPGTRVVFEP